VRSRFQTALAGERYRQIFPHFCNKPILDTVFHYEKQLSMTKNDKLARTIIGCRNRDVDCFSQLVDMYASRCYGYFYRLTGNKDISDELLSTLFAKLVEKIRSYKGGTFESWLFKIASNIFHDYLRSKQRYKKLLDVRKSQLEEETTKSKRSDNEKFDKLQIQISRLDAETRELIMLRFYSQLSFKEIAKMRSEPIGTTLSKLHRGLKRLRELMEG
jgi:RNA polymerase sigma-70 factor (ECF subfamily)